MSSLVQPFPLVGGERRSSIGRRSLDADAILRGLRSGAAQTRAHWSFRKQGIRILGLIVAYGVAAAMLLVGLRLSVASRVAAALPSSILSTSSAPTQAVYRWSGYYRVSPPAVQGGPRMLPSAVEF